MSVSARLAMFVTGLMVAVTAGWGPAPCSGRRRRRPGGSCTPRPACTLRPPPSRERALRDRGFARTDATPLSVELLLGGMTCGAREPH